jgi:hypothetical protein
MAARFAAVVAVAAVAAAVASTHVAPATGAATETFVVAMGDSYISGEAGRWAGNSLDERRSRGGTDRAWVGRSRGWYDRSVVYLDGSDADGCHRADVADIHVADIPGATSVNLACSGAATADVVDRPQKGRPAQVDQLAQVAAAGDVALVVLSIGGNDLGFGDIILACTRAWFTSPSWWEDHCRDEQQQAVDAKMTGAMAGVAEAVAAVRETLDAAGDDYRLVLRSYPSPVPRASELRYRESGWSRWVRGGCPFWDEDADWARDSLAPQIADGLRQVAVASGVEFLDLVDLLEGREVCARSARHVTDAPDGAIHEWVRWLNTGLLQGDAQESLHPNAFGQRAAGACIAAMAASPPGHYACANVAGAGPETVNLTAA